MVREESLVNGVPNIRFLHASRTITGPEDIKVWVKPMLDGLMRPLTEQEKEGGLWNPPHPSVFAKLSLGT